MSESYGHIGNDDSESSVSNADPESSAVSDSDANPENPLAADLLPADCCFPSWAFTKDSADLLAAWGHDDTRCSIADFCPRPHILARRGAFLLISGVLFQFAWSIYWYWEASCTRDSFNDWTAKVVAIMITGILAFLEFNCMKWVILPWQHKAKKFTLPLFPWKVPYCVWLAQKQGLSALVQGSVQANAHLAGSMVGCKYEGGFEKLCGVTLSISVLLTCIVLPVQTIIYTRPTPWALDDDSGKILYDDAGKKKMQKVRWDFGREPDKDTGTPSETEVRWYVWSQWLGLDDWQSTHFEATLDWSRTAFMQCLENVTISVTAAEMSLFLQQMKDGKHEMVRQYIRRFQFMCRKQFIFMIKVGLMKSSLQLIAQVSLYTVLRQQAHSHYQEKNLKTLLVNFAATLGTEIGIVIDIFSYACKAMRVDHDTVMTAIQKYPQASPGYEQRDDLYPEATRWFKRFVLVSSLVLLSWTGALCLLIRAAPSFSELRQF